MVRTLLWSLLAADSSGYGRGGKPLLPAERLGNSYSYIGLAHDQGLAVEEWWNETLDRQEFWYKPVGGEFYLRVNGGTYVLGRHQAGEWNTIPSLQLVHRDGKWLRLTLGLPGR